MKATLLSLALLATGCFAEDVERPKAVEKCIIFRDADAAKVNEAILNFLKTEPYVLRVLQSESTSFRNGYSNPNGNVDGRGFFSSNILTITIFYKEK